MLSDVSASSASSDRDDVQLSNGRIVCRACRAHIAYLCNLESKTFRGRNGGKAALFSEIVNVTLSGSPEVRLMTSGAHTVEEIDCTHCGTYLGWKILRAHEWTERWKAGKFVIERDLVAAERVRVVRQRVMSPIDMKDFADEERFRMKLAVTAERTARWRADVFVAHTSYTAISSTMKRQNSRNAGQWGAAFHSFAPIIAGA